VYNECNEISVYRWKTSEAIEIEYDPSEISYRELLGMFWKNHDPTAYHEGKPVSGLTEKGLPDTLVLWWQNW
jgi:peptide methionine sulfoxide reductase MsrA